MNAAGVAETGGALISSAAGAQDTGAAKGLSPVFATSN
jgi:hypothetical protein